ncbi:shikimate dehydrogenase [Agromyces cerinus]|uniref:Shikimate dehydrogenase n=1 Tax=Agromyces cerinus subsp. cerinus TaxID=232089 RepID=A0A1N6DTC5_9MICO|nr:shikimate dehydrogenase [Agromyces cerinus]SIN73944.1 shikimate dehydrogenase [Agromyces cerinus subsp. cerinus]
MAERPRPLHARLAVLGSPISHSKSPALHRAAYDRLGLSWQYSAVEMDGDRLGEFLGGLDASWRGLSLTMPLKQDVLPLLDSIDEVAAITGAANTVLFDGGTRRGFNTDVGGIVRTLREAGVHEASHGVLLGGGATAASALVAMSQLGAREVQVLVRRPGAAAPLVELGSRLGIDVHEGRPTELATIDRADLVVSTVPGGTDLGVAASAGLISSAALLDVAYDPWPTPLAAGWFAGGGAVVHGLGMLLHQALLQVRIFVNGDPNEPLDDEDAVLAVMRDAVA